MSTNKAPLTLISTAETAGVLLHLEIWGAELWILMRWVLGELSGFSKGNEFKQCVDLYEYLLHVEELHWQDRVNIEEGERERKGTFSTFLSLNQSSSIVLWLWWQCYSFAIWLLAPSISFCFTFVLFQSMPSSQNLLYSFHPPQPNIRPPRVLWMGLWRSRWSHTEDMGTVPK